MAGKRNDPELSHGWHHLQRAWVGVTARWAAICHRMEKDIVAANPDIPPPKSPVTVFLVGSLLGFAGLVVVSKWFSPNM